ncbi:hypothetical protein NMG60_11035650 [Bertholletia excelsa]
MDEFGVLVESIGFKAQGKSAPMACLKGKSNMKYDSSLNFSNYGKSQNYGDSSMSKESFDYNIDGIFRPRNSGKSRRNGGLDGFDDVFGGPIKPSGGDFDLDSIFKGSSNFGSRSSVYGDDDIFGMPGLKASTPVKNSDVLRSIPPPPKQTAQAGDLLGNFSGLGLGSNGLRKKSEEVVKNDQEFDDLIPGFGGSSHSRNGDNAETDWSSLANGHSAEDPFVVLENISSQSYASDRAEKDARKSSSFSSVDELEEFAMGKVRSSANKHSHYPQKEKVETFTQDLDSFFSTGSQSSNGLRSKSTAVDPVFDSLFKSEEEFKVEQSRNVAQSRTSSKTKKASSATNTVASKTKKASSATNTVASKTKKASSTTNIVDDFSFFFEAAPSSGEFQEIEGEPEERRRARLNHHMRTQQRMAKALAEKNQRDFEVQQEQEERHRVAETLNDNIKRWAAGKEGNLRALLSSLQQVLWPECGWQPVSLTDLITSVSVKKVYQKATLCVHPDKVQQRGANVEQKYIAEKVFDLLKEAWNKFNADEL